MTRVNGAVTSYDYDQADRLADLHPTVGGSTVNRFVCDVNRSYAYDGLLRLSEATESSGTSYAYSYDLAGNRTTVTANGSTTTTAYNAANQVGASAVGLSDEAVEAVEK